MNACLAALSKRRPLCHYQAVTSLIDTFMPEYDIVKRHRIVIDAPPKRAYEAVRALEMRGSWVTGALIRLREIPGMFAHRRDPDRDNRLGTTIDDLLRAGFVQLGERAGDELLLGLAGKPWTLTGGIRRVQPEEFATFDRPGFALVTWNFRLRSTKSGKTSVTTETRVRCTDARSRFLFRTYWLLVGPFSGIIRSEALRLIKRDAELVAPAPETP